MSKPNKLVLVTGANKGIGLECCRQMGKQGYHVLLTARDVSKGQAAAQKLQEVGIAVDAFPLDVSSNNEPLALASEIESRFGHLDALINNAGILIENMNPAHHSDPTQQSASALQTPLEIVQRTIDTNTYGPFRMMQAMYPLLEKAPHGCIVNVSSGMGTLSDMSGSWPGYRLSKTALNALTRIFAAELKEKGILVNSVCPGWVRSDMGGASAARPLEKGAETIVWAASLPEEGPTGMFFRDKEAIDW